MKFNMLEFVEENAPELNDGAYVVDLYDGTTELVHGDQATLLDMYSDYLFEHKELWDKEYFSFQDYKDSLGI